LDALIPDKLEREKVSVRSVPEAKEEVISEKRDVVSD